MNPARCGCESGGPRRRGWLLGVVAGTLGASVGLVAGCSRDQGTWAEGMKPIKWDRDVCVRCAMLLSDRRFAVQMRSSGGETANFDDIGCAFIYVIAKAAEQPWLAEPSTRWWVAEVGSEDGSRWLDAKKAHYAPGVHSPMGYDFAAYPAPQPGSVDFEAVRVRVMAVEKAAAEAAAAARAARKNAP
ncbi:MAG: hypothetical protein IPM15_12645 [Betaproteobacteria bacterium]|nr:hypothetical protein [Betaproteobacteria bacterium]